MPNNLSMQKLLPALIVGVLALGFAGAVVTDWLFDMWHTSVRIEGRYAKQITPPAAPIQLPKDSYLCGPNAKNPWVGCTIR